MTAGAIVEASQNSMDPIISEEEGLKRKRISGEEKQDPENVVQAKRSRDDSLSVRSAQELGEGEFTSSGLTT